MHCLYYNMDLLGEAGVDGPPTTGEEFIEIGKLLTVDANGNHPDDEGFDPDNVVQYAVNMHSNHHAFFQWWALYNQLGGELISEDGTECVMDIDKAAQAWQYLQDLVYTHHIAPQGQTDYARDFLSGRTAMLIDGPWQMATFEAATEESGFNWNTAMYPRVFDEAYATWGSGHNITLPARVANPENRDEALQFIEWLAANSTEWANVGQLPAFSDVMESEEFRTMYGREAFIEMMPYEVFLPGIPLYNQVFASNAPTPMMVMAQSIMLEQADPASAAQTACDEITFILQNAITQAFLMMGRFEPGLGRPIRGIGNLPLISGDTMRVLPRPRPTSAARSAGQPYARWTPYLFLLPYLLVFLLFRLGPSIFGLAMSFTKWSIVGSPQWIGTRNYELMQIDPRLDQRSEPQCSYRSDGALAGDCQPGVWRSSQPAPAGRALDGCGIHALCPHVTVVGVCGMAAGENFGLVNVYLGNWVLAGAWLMTRMSRMYDIILTPSVDGRLWDVTLSGRLTGHPGELYEAAH